MTKKNKDTQIDVITKILSDQPFKEIDDQIFKRLTPYMVYSILFTSYKKNKNVDCKKLYRILDEVPWNEVDIF